ncbi:4'-phosphopantetheinyl transferase [Stackebrandtia endophytica]|uniref:4'-phosphopantetheinyl transferase n=1 Tax=Stackebrandtia endophytica TaxID=1496996 RepID=A0A543AVX3_9ACTN|nr:4'-phosphopantetheinyl transferase [Stackebrandtia endophytica]
MIDLVIARSDPLEDSTLHRIRAAVPPTRRQKCDRYHRRTDRQAGIVSFSLLQYLWRRRSPDPLPEIVLGRFGKPRFQGVRDRHFNWSHDASICVCVLAATPVGVDVQSPVPYDDALFERITTPGERYLRDRFQSDDDMSLLWTRKEAIVKRTGRGLTTPLREVDTLASNVLTLASVEPRYHLSLSAEGLDQAALRSRLRISWLQPSPTAHLWTTRDGDGLGDRSDLRPYRPNYPAYPIMV